MDDIALHFIEMLKILACEMQKSKENKMKTSEIKVWIVAVHIIPPTKAEW